VTRAVLRKIGETQLAWIAGDRAVHAARAAERPLELAEGARALGLVFLADGRLAEADSVVAAGLRGLESHGLRRSRASWSVWGALSLMGALVAARKGDRLMATGYLDQVARAASEVGSDANDLRTGFGPTNVAIHRVSVGVELGDPAEALKRANEVDVSNLPDQFRERRSSLLIEVARAYSQRRDKGAAVLQLHRQGNAEGLPQTRGKAAHARPLAVGTTCRHLELVESVAGVGCQPAQADLKELANSCDWAELAGVVCVAAVASGRGHERADPRGIRAGGGQPPS
jgi:hypothetical protein